MTFSNSRKPFHAAEEMHPLTFQTLIGACLKPRSFVVDFTTSICIHYFKPFIVAVEIHSKMYLNILLRKSMTF
jgi:hypothetical protein